MRNRLPVTLPDEMYAEVETRATADGVTVEQWVVAAIEREAFRQLCAEQNQWSAQHPDQLGDPVTEHERRSRMRAERGSSAA